MIKPIPDEIPKMVLVIQSEKNPPINAKGIVWSYSHQRRNLVQTLSPAPNSRLLTSELAYKFPYNE